VSQTPQVWLDHQVMEEGGALVFNWDAVEALFPDGLLDAMFAAYCGLLEQLAVEEEAWTAADLGVVPDEQLERRAEVNATASPVSSGLLHTLFEGQAAQRGDRVAVAWAGGTLTYGELDERSNRVGRWLRERGAAPNQLVALVMEKGWEQVVGALGVLKSGAAYLPIDPGLPEERVRYLLENGDVQLVLTREREVERVAWPEGVTCLSVDGETLAETEAGRLETVQGPEDLAYVIYTSGSTGQPKGVMIDHRGAVNTILDVNARFGVGAEDGVLALSRLSFDLSVYDVFGLLAAGGRVVIPGAGEARDPGSWAGLMAQEEVTVWNTVPALMEMLVEYLEGRGERLPEGLRLVLMSGDWIPVGLPDRIKRLGQEVTVISLGGATEASIWSILYPIEEVEGEWKSIPYGKPMLNQQFHVLDEGLEACPEWVTGELYIGGVGLARGYWKDAVKTEARFIEHPRTGERLYRTGDLGRYLPDGNIEFLGREDLQVKVQGYRIELGEVEAALERHPAVRTGVVAAVGEQRGRRRLVGYVVEETPTTDEALREHLLESLPEYMVPGAFVRLESLPLTPNGKVDRRALPAHDPAQCEGKRFVAPRTPIEEDLAEIFGRILGVEQVGIYDNFFELGGDSVLATQLVSQVRQAFGIDLPLSAMFVDPTVVNLTLEVVKQQAGGEKDEALSQLLDELDAMSEEDLATILATGEAQAGSISD
jgi:amino acid adenylation domain-containing protein